jgi:hypothetical protein
MPRTLHPATLATQALGWTDTISMPRLARPGRRQNIARFSTMCARMLTA